MSRLKEFIERIYEKHVGSNMELEYRTTPKANVLAAMVQINSKPMKEEKTAIPLTKEELLPTEEGNKEEMQDQLWNDAFNEVSKHAFEHGVRLTMTETAILDNFLDIS